MSRSKLYFDFMMQLWPLGRMRIWAAQQPLLHCLIKNDARPDRSQHIIVPVNQVISGTESVVLPLMVIEALIARASCLVVMNKCICRRAEHCQSFPHEVGCLFLGDAAGQINPALCRSISPNEAQVQARHAIEIGLTPMIIHSAFDSELLGIDFHRMLAVCFCCDCCCTVLQTLRSGPREFGDTVQRFPGLYLEVGPECIGCGACLDVCNADALSLVDDRLVIGEDCKGCGSCAAACPLDAIQLRMDEGNQALERLISLVEERTSIGPMKDSPSNGKMRLT